MKQHLKVGIIGDHNPTLRSHITTEEALAHAAQFLEITLKITWLPTTPLESDQPRSKPLMPYGQRLVPMKIETAYGKPSVLHENPTSCF